MNITVPNNIPESIKSLPVGDSEADAARRKQLWKSFDDDQTGQLSLAKIDKGVRDVLKIPELFQAKPVLIRAYEVAKSKVKGNKSYSDDFVSRSEFKFLLIYIKLYYSIWVEFDIIDKSDDRRIEEQEFINGLPVLKQWGVTVSNPHKTFAEIKAQNHEVTYITFHDFAHWAITEHLKQH